MLYVHLSENPDPIVSYLKTGMASLPTPVFIGMYQCTLSYVKLLVTLLALSNSIFFLQMVVLYENGPSEG